MPRERAYPGHKPLLCELAWCDGLGVRTTTLSSGQAIRLCGPHAEALVPGMCDCSYYLQQAGAVLRCDLPFGHVAHHRHPNSDLRWGSA